MTRIIAGFAGSLTLHVPRSGTRPTSDRVREAIFSALEARDEITGARVFDLYAGSGALGLEAASRGAAEVVLVERSKPAAEICRRNAQAVMGAAENAAIRSAPWLRVATQAVTSFLESSSIGADLVFVDPPYELTEGELARVLTLLRPRLTAGATVVVERSSRSPEPAWPRGLTVDRRRDYGETTLWWAFADHGAYPVLPSHPA